MRMRILTAVLAATAMVANAAGAAAQEDSAAELPTLIGEAARDLVFTPVPRCRVIDTRVAVGRLTAGIPRDFDVAGPLSGQGGADDCLIPFGPATVVVIKLTTVQPIGSGNLRVWAFGTAMPAASLINFRQGLRAGVNVSTELHIPICNAAVASCTRDLTVQAEMSDTHFVAEVSGYFSGVTGIPWSMVTGKPLGFADNTDNDTQYSAGAGLNLVGTTFSVDPLEIQSRVTQTCAAGSSIRAVGLGGTVTCEPDTDTTYTGGPGINVSGGTISVANLGVSSPMLAAGAVSAGKIAPNAVTFAEIADRSILTADIALGAITNGELSSFAVGANKIATGVVGQSEIATDGVGASEIAAGAVGRSEIDGTERAIYRMRAACHADGITTSATCTTPLCSPVPIPIFWSCGNNCDSFVPVECDNTLLGYLLGPSID